MSEPGEAQRRFCEVAWPRLVGAVSHYCGDRYVAEELVQEALIRACERWRHVSGLSAPEGWVYRVAVNLAVSRWRRVRAERRARERYGAELSGEEIVAVEDQLAVREALRGLSRQQHEAVILRYVLELSVEEAAQVLETTPGAVRALTHRATIRLRQRLAVDEPIEQEVTDGT